MSQITMLVRLPYAGIIQIRLKGQYLTDTISAGTHQHPCIQLSFEAIIHRRQRIGNLACE
jgi:hypothetical protein